MAREQTIGAVMVVGGGIAGMQAALDLANSGYYMSICWNGVARSAAPWPNWTKPSRPTTARCELSHRNWLSAVGA